MAAVPCQACGERMNEAVVACPHCGARRAAGGLAGKLSKDEIGALLATDPSLRDREAPRGLLPMLVLPHPATSGASRTAELALTVASMPLVLVGAISVGITRRRARHATVVGELGPVLAMTLMGGLGLWSLLGLLGASTTVVLNVVGGSIAALWARGIVRWRSATSRGRDLSRVERMPLPEARAVEAPALREIPAPAPVVAPAREPDPPPGDQPRVLR